MTFVIASAGQKDCCGTAIRFAISQPPRIWLVSVRILLVTVLLTVIGCGGSERMAAPETTTAQDSPDTVASDVGETDQSSPTEASGSQADVFVHRKVDHEGGASADQTHSLELSSPGQVGSPKTAVPPSLELKPHVPRTPLDGPRLEGSAKQREHRTPATDDLTIHSSPKPSVPGAGALNMGPSQPMDSTFPATETPELEERLTSVAPEEQEGTTAARSAENSDATDHASMDSEETSLSHVNANQVDVFFATDRLPTSQVVPSMFRTFLPALAVGMLSWAMFIGLSVARKFQAFWMMGAGLATCLGITVLHVCVVRHQTYSRLSKNASTRFSVLRFEPNADEYPLHVGTARVTIPESHKKGGFERPSLLKLEFREDPRRHIVLHSVEVEEHASNWFENISERVRYASEREGFVFVHGYNVKFGDALMRTAQLATDLDIRGPVISYSWPSKGRISAYSADEATVSWSAPNFERLLVDLASQTEIRKVNIVAHSMGNRALLETVERLYLRSGVARGYVPKNRLIGSMILAAPDVDAQLFESRYVEAIQGVSDRATVYFTDNDRALQLSQRLHDTPRLGLGRLPKNNAIEAIDTGSHGIFSLGHSYYGSDPIVIDDMKRVLNYHESAGQRQYLQELISETGAKYWEIDRELHAQLETGKALR